MEIKEQLLPILKKKNPQTKTVVLLISQICFRLIVALKKKGKAEQFIL